MMLKLYCSRHVLLRGSTSMAISSQPKTPSKVKSDTSQLHCGYYPCGGLVPWSSIWFSDSANALNEKGKESTNKEKKQRLINATTNKSRRDKVTTLMP
eukprot:24168-Amphidinium_carterae.1